MHFLNAVARRRVQRLAAALVACAFSASAQAPLDVRVALVIGNAAYPAPAGLDNPGRDAVAMATALRKLGFAVTEVRDGTAAQMREAIARTTETLRGRRGVGMLYYAGHGVQLDWHNYMVPVDQPPASAADVRQRAVDVDSVIEGFKGAGTRMNILVLDACRDSPFAGSANARGLAQMDAPTGTFLAYATAPGNVAEDGGSGGHGLYTGFLLQELARPQARIEDVFKRVRLQVRQKSQGRQIPWESTSLEDDFYFNDGAAASDRAGQLERLAAEAGRRQATAGDTQLPAVQEMEKRLERDLPELNRLRDEALAAESAEWERIRASRNPDVFYDFLRRFPSGLLAEQAQFRLDQVQQAQVVPAPGRDGVVMLRSGAQRYYQGDELIYDDIDGFTKQRRRVRQRVTAADAERVEINGGRSVWDQMGGVLKNNRGEKNFAVVVAPPDLAIGKKWRSAGVNVAPNGTEHVTFWNNRAVAREDVTVPAGTFRAFRIERSGETRSPRGKITFKTGTVWIDPKTMIVVRMDDLYRSEGKITEYTSRELIEARLVVRP